MTNEQQGSPSAGAKPRKDYKRHLEYNRGYKTAVRANPDDSIFKGAPKREGPMRDAFLNGVRAGMRHPAFQKRLADWQAAHPREISEMESEEGLSYLFG